MYLSAALKHLWAAVGAAPRRGTCPPRRELREEVLGVAGPSHEECTEAPSA